MTRDEYFKLAEELAARAGVQEGLHSYFLSHRDRLFETARRFGVWELRQQDILEIARSSATRRSPSGPAGTT